VGQAAPRAASLAILIVVIAAVIGLCIIVFLLAANVNRTLGTTGNLLLSRPLGAPPAALAVQYVIDGLRAVLESRLHHRERAKQGGSWPTHRAAVGRKVPYGANRNRPPPS
jgi:hypothetical protein